MRPDVQPAVGFVPVWIALSTRCPAPSSNTFEVLFVIVSISPVPKLLPGPVSYCQVPVGTPVPAAPVKSSLQVAVQPAGGLGTAALATPAKSRAPAARPTTASANLLMGSPCVRIAWLPHPSGRHGRPLSKNTGTFPVTPIRARLGGSRPLCQAENAR